MHSIKPNSTFIVKVAITVPLRRCFEYLVAEPLAIELKPSMRVKVPFGSSFKIGVIDSVTAVNFNGSQALSVNELQNDSNVTSELQADITKLKPIHLVIDEYPLLPESIIKLYQWMKNYYHSPPGEIWQTILPNALMKGKEARLPRTSYWKITATGKDALDNNQVKLNAVKQRQALKLLSEQTQGIEQAALAKFKINAATIKSLVGKKWIEQDFINSSNTTTNNLINVNDKKQLNTQQQSAYNTITDKLNSYYPALLFGVTASGKTEVYLQLIEQVINMGKQALVLVPEIGLTPQTLARFQKRFNVNIVTLHSNMTDQQRLNSWLKAKSGQAQIIIGTRSAIFTPLANPGVIIIDEEHDSSFKQQQGFRYSARDVALVRASLENTPVLLGSATPSLEALNNVAKGKISQLKLTEKAQNTAQLNYRIIDLKQQVMRNGLSVELIETIKKHLANKNQILLFLNRRGYAPVLLCHQCGWSDHCKRCDTHFTYHHQSHYLQCHHCGSHRKAPQKCPQCSCTQMVPVGLGTERLEETIGQIFPSAKVARIDRDTTRKKSAMQSYVNAIKQGDVDILIGTQMLAKGHHFPHVTLVAMVDMDGALYSADYRAAEYAAQLITQVSGRAGRAEKSGEVIIQTHHSEHPMLKQLLHKGYEYFSTIALRERIETELPPHSYAALFQAESPKLEHAKQFLNDVRQVLNRYNNLKVDLLGPAPALYVKKAGKYRYQLFLQTNKRNELHHLLDLTLEDIEKLKSARKVRWRLEVDPVGD